MRNLAIAVICLLTVVAVGIAVVGGSFDRPRTAPSPTSVSQSGSAIETVAGGLEVPWDIAFLSKTKALVTERPGRVRVLENDRLRGEPALTLATVARGEGGLQGMAISPDFERDRFVYLYASESSGDDLTNQVVRYRLDDADKLVNERVLLDDIPGNANHNGGRLRFGPDRKLYVTTGDAQDPDLAQEQGSLAGKILRMNPDGSVPADNPFDNLVWSFGHRNPQGLAWDSEGRLYATEHGPTGEFGLCCRDELNRIERGGNYGWPLITGTERRFGLGMPILSSGNSVAWAPASLTIKDGRLYFGALRDAHLHEVTIEDDRVSDDRELFKDEFGRIRTVATGPDGALYILTSNRDGRGEPQKGDDRIIRVSRLPE
ncbi:MAG TPA: PQQ-dependent sugar dehydrogenase [Patescibacteria group bacterium]|jgi:glucose/arabinose dehydrogenase